MKNIFYLFFIVFFVLGCQQMTEPEETNIYDSDSSTGPQVTPSAFNLDSVYPNPFKTKANIIVELPVKAKINLVVQNALGDILKVLVSEEVPAGRHSFSWNGKNEKGKKVNEGLYFITLEAKKHNYISSFPVIFGEVN